ncbi:MAG: HlyD family type I secretion periplasmic adaptor subunit [Selenomonadaceae bacterium]|nr:HlyD family type I secretion periplasmic adaptor subunit [Selenomonadaceae bacterium]
MRVWQRMRAFFRGEDRTADAEFMPAMLEVTETPPSPVGRLMLYAILALLAAGGAWAYLGHIDETAVAEGKVIPAGQVKTIQVKNKSIVREIRVKDGDMVHEGDVLVVLDPTSTEADYDSLSKRAAYFHLDIERLQAELDGAEFAPSAEELAVLETADATAEQQLFASRRGQYAAARQAAEATVAQKQAAYEAASASWEKYQGQYQIALEKEQRLEQLVSENAVAEFQLLEQRSQRIEFEKNTKAQADTMEQAQGELAEAQKKLADVEASYQKDVMSQLVESRKQYQVIQEEIKKADQDAQLTTVKAPCDGRVYNLAVHTVGAIVTDAQALMLIVPSDTALQFEVWADNKDIGFIHEGQDVAVKVETFDFQKYGTIDAEVEEVSPDAAADERDVRTFQKYRLLLKPERTLLDSLTAKKELTPGMNVTAEVKIRQKRIVDYFLDPFRKYTSESLRER